MARPTAHLESKCNSLAQHSLPPLAAPSAHRSRPLSPHCLQVERGEDGYANVRHVCSLAAHLSTVNCVRFSPTGEAAAQLLAWDPKGCLVCACGLPCQTKCPRMRLALSPTVPA